MTRRRTLNTELRLLYPLLVAIWLIAHISINEQISRSSRVFNSMRMDLDDSIPFVPDMAILYFSGFLLGNMAYIILSHERIFPYVAAGYALQFVVSITIYMLYPCRIDRYEGFIPRDPIASLLASFQRISKPFNSFPSMHVSYGLFSALSIWSFGSTHLGFLMLAWAVLVALSSLLTRQHYVIEVLSGAGLGLGAYWITWVLAHSSWATLLF